MIKPQFVTPAARQGFLYQTSNVSAYVYPDYQTALVGKFENNEMISAQKANIKSVTCENDELRLEFTKPTGTIFKLDLGSTDSFGSMPLVPDPMEDTLVYVADSHHPNAGDFNQLFR